MFYLRINYSLPTQVKLVAFSDTILDLVDIMHLDYGRNPYEAKLRIVYNAEIKEVLFTKCFDGAVLVNQILQMGVYEYLQEAYTTFFCHFQNNYIRPTTFKVTSSWLLKFLTSTQIAMIRHFHVAHALFREGGATK